MAYLLGISIEELNELSYDELAGWMEYFKRRPPGWRADNRAAVVAMSMGGGKLKPEDLFDSLRVMRRESNSSASDSVASKFVDRFKNKFTEKAGFLND